MSTVRILGVDPGSRKTGVGIIESCGSQLKPIHFETITAKGADFADRLFSIHEQLDKIIAEYLPQESAIEKVFMHKNFQSALKLGQARGAALVVLAKYALVIDEYSPREIKQAVVGYGAAKKEQIQMMVRSILSIKETVPEDAADALGIAITHANMRQYKKRIADSEKKLNAGATS